MRSFKLWILLIQGVCLVAFICLVSVAQSRAEEKVAAISNQFAPAPITAKDPGPRTANPLDEDCLPADSLTIMLNATNDHVVLNFWAGQPGTYHMYTTTDPTNSSDPPFGAGWNGVGLLSVGGPAHASWTDPSALVPYIRYAITHSCPVPSNDDCVNATPVSSGITYFSTIGATTDGPDEPSHCNYFGSSQVGQDIWFFYLATCTGPLTISLCGSHYDTKLAVYNGSICPTNGTALACNDDYCGLQSLVTLNVNMNTYYLIRVGGYMNNYGTGVMNISPGALNDNCTDALPTNYGTTSFNTRCAETTSDTTDCGQIYKNLWFTLTAQQDLTTTVSLCGSSFNTKLAVYYSATSDCNGLTQVVCNDDFCAQQSQVSFVRTEVSGMYYIRVGGATSGDFGQATMLISHN